MSHGNDPVGKTQPSLTDEELIFLRDEGLDLLAQYRSIREKSKRDLVLELIRTIAADQPPNNGG